MRALSDSTLSLTVEGEELGKLAFLPGQYVNLQVPGSEHTRAYSFSSMPRDGQVSFLIRNVPGGLMSGYLTGAAKAGDAVTMTGPLGSFYLREVQRPLLLLHRHEILELAAGGRQRHLAKHPRRDRVDTIRWNPVPGKRLADAG